MVPSQVQGSTIGFNFLVRELIIFRNKDLVGVNELLTPESKVLSGISRHYTPMIFNGIVDSTRDSLYCGSDRSGFLLQTRGISFAECRRRTNLEQRQKFHYLIQGCLFYEEAVHARAEVCKY